ncbi:MAG: Uma2 family endonuclease, partial [Planctomycetes bacterium]|nr:Uma2 family endonuclease [Planctomycetota bacterium]
ELDLKSYLLWKTDVPPAVAFEIVSPGNEYKDVVGNREVYARLGIGEYYWFNPASSELVALCLDAGTGEYRPLDPDVLGRYWSPALGLHVGLENGRIALYREGRYVPPTEELRKEAELHYEEAERRRQDAERMVLDLERRLKELQGDRE